MSMANHTVTDNPDGTSTIAVHGRGSLAIDYKEQDDDGNQIDISGQQLFFEVDGPPIRIQLVADPSDPKGQLIKLTRTLVEKLKKTPSNWTVIDETDMEDDMPVVTWNGTISRTGYVGEPDTDGGN